jgi:hypothetical protein
MYYMMLPLSYHQSRVIVIIVRSSSYRRHTVSIASLSNSSAWPLYPVAVAWRISQILIIDSLILCQQTSFDPHDYLITLSTLHQKLIHLLKLMIRLTPFYSPVKFFNFDLI